MVMTITFCGGAVERLFPHCIQADAAICACVRQPVLGAEPRQRWACGLLTNDWALGSIGTPHSWLRAKTDFLKQYAWLHRRRVHRGRLIVRAAPP